MMFFRTLLHLICPCAGFALSIDGGGAGNSSSTSHTSTENTDMRVVGGADSINQSLKLVTGDNAKLTMTDQGAVAGGLKLAMAGVEGANALASQTIAAQGGLLNGALKMAGDQQREFTEAVENIKTSDVRVLVVAGLAVVGLGAVFLFKK